MFSLRLLGGLSLGDGAGVITGRAAQKRRLALLCLIATVPSRTQSRDKLIGYLWPESDTEQARHLLSVALHELRKVLGDDVILSRGDDITLATGRLQTDVQAFEKALAEGALDEAVALYAGPFLDGFFISEAPELERWVDGERDRLARLYQRALERLALERADAGDNQGAAEAWRKLATLEPFNSRIAARLMEALAASGDRVGALRHAKLHEAILKEEFGVEMDPEVVRLAARIRDDPAPDPPTAKPTLVGNGVTDPDLPTDGAMKQGRLSSIAVLPFADVSPARDNQYFSDGLTEEIINLLGQVRGIRVAARTSTFAARLRGMDVQEVGKALRVRAVLEGSVRKAGDRLRIAVSLVDVASGYNLWGETYDREGGDVFAVQDQIARAVVGALHGHLTDENSAPLLRAPTADLEAYNLYLKGRYHWYRRNIDGLTRAMSYFEQAVSRDSGYALAHAGIGDVYNLLAAPDYGTVHPNDAFPAAKEAIARALELDPRLAIAHATLGNILLTYDWDWNGAELQFRRALQLDPDCAQGLQWYAMGLLVAGRVDEAMLAIRRAREVEPLSVVLCTAVGRLFYFARQTDRAIEEYQRALEMDPKFVPAHLGLGLACVQMGDLDRAIDEYATADQYVGEGQPLILALKAHAGALAGRTAEAASVLTDLESAATRRYIPSEYFVLVHLGLGDLARALDSLEAAVANRSGSIPFLGVDPILDPLRSEPHFRAMLRRLGIRSPLDTSR